MSHYCHLFLRYVLGRIDQCNTVTTVASSINILAAVHRVVLAWLKVKPDIICKCFRKTEVLGSTLDVVTHGIEVEEDPLLEINECIELQSLLDVAVSPTQAC